MCQLQIILYNHCGHLHYINEQCHLPNQGISCAIQLLLENVPPDRSCQCCKWQWHHWRHYDARPEDSFNPSIKIGSVEEYRWRVSQYLILKESRQSFTRINAAQRELNAPIVDLTLSCLGYLLKLYRETPAEESSINEPEDSEYFKGVRMNDLVAIISNLNSWFNRDATLAANPQTFLVDHRYLSGIEHLIELIIYRPGYTKISELVKSAVGDEIIMQQYRSINQNIQSFHQNSAMDMS